MGDGANVASGKVKVGPIKLGAGVAVKSPVRAGYGAVGAIIQFVGGAIQWPLSARTDLNKLAFELSKRKSAELKNIIGKSNVFTLCSETL